MSSKAWNSEPRHTEAGGSAMGWYPGHSLWQGRRKGERAVRSRLGDRGQRNHSMISQQSKTSHRSSEAWWVGMLENTTNSPIAFTIMGVPRNDPEHQRRCYVIVWLPCLKADAFHLKRVKLKMVFGRSPLYYLKNN